MYGNIFLIALHIFSIGRKEPFAGENGFPAGEREASAGKRGRLALVWPGSGEGAGRGKVERGKWKVENGGWTTGRRV
jgi:hypothetical protein